MHAQQISLRENSFDKNNDDRTLMTDIILFSFVQDFSSLIEI